MHNDTADYHDFTTIDMPVDKRRPLDVGDVWINAAKCLDCSETIRSKHRHDAVTCPCGNLMVDGGSWYCKRIAAHGVDSYEDLSEPFLDLPPEASELYADEEEI